MTTLDEIRKRWAAATPGKWSAVGESSGIEAEDGRWLAAVYNAPDRQAIAHAPADIAWLLAEVERLKGEAAAHEGALVDSFNRGADGYRGLVVTTLRNFAKDRRKGPLNRSEQAAVALLDCVADSVEAIAAVPVSGEVENG